MLINRYFIQTGKAVLLAVLLALAALSPARATTVWTQRNDNSRSGAVLNETVLNQSNVNPNTFGYLFTCAVDNTVYTQPLYVPNVSVNGTIHNMLYVGTVTNTMYAFDADDGAIVWSNAYPTAPSIADAGIGCGCPYYGPNAGLTGTPVIDTSTNTMYFSTRSKNTDGTFSIWLRAVDLATGVDKFNSPQALTVSEADVAQGGSFNPQYLYQRAALTLAGGTVYLSFASLCDCGDYRGWTLGYQASDISKQQYAFSDSNVVAPTPPDTGNTAGLWMAGNGFAVDSTGNIYLATGNGAFDGSVNYGDSIMKVTPSLSVLDWFTPSDQATLSANDLDVGSGGVTLLPGGNRLVGGGKDGRLFLVDTTTGQMGGYSPSQDNVLEEFQATTAGAGNVRETPVYYNSPTNGLTLYIWPNGDGIKGFQYAGDAIGTTPIVSNPIGDGVYDSVLSVSANGSAPGTGIVWASESNPNFNLFGSNTLYAFDADTLSVLYDSNEQAARDSKIGSWVRFTPPTVANGKVYVPSNGGGGTGVAVFGLLNGQTRLPTALTATAGYSQVALAWTAAGGATSYMVYRSSASSQEQAPALATGVTTPSYTDTAGTNGTTYYYTVTTIGRNGQSVMSNEASAAPIAPPPPPAAPINLTATGADRQVVLNWTAPSGLVLGYTVQDGTTPGGETALTTVTATTYTVTGLTDGTTYYFTVAAYNPGGQGSASNEASATPLAVEPSAPTGLIATPGNGQITLNWPPAAGASSYNLYRGTASGAEGISPYKTGIVPTSYVDIGLVNGTTYYYTVTAVSDGGENQTHSPEVSATPLTGITFSPGLQLFSIPYDYPGASLDSLFGYSGVKLAVWSPAAISYSVTPAFPADAIRPGTGYWARFPQEVTITAVGTPASTSQPFQIQLSAGWNQIGDPFTVQVPISSLTFNSGQVTYAQATAGSPALIGDIYGYAAADGYGEPLTASQDLVVDGGYWIYASSSTTMLVPYP